MIIILPYKLLYFKSTKKPFDFAINRCTICFEQYLHNYSSVECRIVLICTYIYTPISISLILICKFLRLSCWLELDISPIKTTLNNTLRTRCSYYLRSTENLSRAMYFCFTFFWPWECFYKLFPYSQVLDLYLFIYY
uniref:Uncharacterized protein n=1 Tax=Cacopsylla melanoneura TaxID=428564 RepID=A0A8D8LNM6_9HEMI